MREVDGYDQFAGNYRWVVLNQTPQHIPDFRFHWHFTLQLNRKYAMAGSWIGRQFEGAKQTCLVSTHYDGWYGKGCFGGTTGVKFRDRHRISTSRNPRKILGIGAIAPTEAKRRRATSDFQVNWSVRLTVKFTNDGRADIDWWCYRNDPYVYD